MKRIFFWMTLGVVMLMASCKPEPVKVSVVATSDLENSIFAYDYKNSQDARGGAVAVASYLKELKANAGEQGVVFVDNGDMLSGWPLSMYLNSAEGADKMFSATAMNALGCEVYSIGEGDLAQGKELVSRYVKEMKGAAVCANLVDAASGEPVYKPYAVVERNGMKIAFLGLITEWADKYMNESYMQGVKVVDAEAAARKWIETIKKNEQPDAIIGLFHMGASSVSKRTKSRENMAVTIVRNVSGFDAVVCGHDGMRRSRTVESIDGKKVVLASPGRRGMYVVDITITAEPTGKGFENKMVDVAIKSMIAREYDKEYVAFIRPFGTELRKMLNAPFAKIDGDAKAVDALFGPSAFMNFIHNVQLKYTGADLSLAHPHDINGGYPSGEISAAYMRSLYPGRGKLYTVKMTGSEIYEILKFSAYRYYNTLENKDSELLRYDFDKKKLAENCKVVESVAGLRYNVHVNKSKKDDRVQVLGLANGKPFDMKKEYTVAVGEDYIMNANLCVNLGAGIKPNQMLERVVAVSEKDLVELVYDYIKENKNVAMKPMTNWTLQPAAWMKSVKENEMKTLTGIYFKNTIHYDDEPFDVTK